MRQATEVVQDHCFEVEVLIAERAVEGSGTLIGGFRLVEAARELADDPLEVPRPRIARELVTADDLTLSIDRVCETAEPDQLGYVGLGRQRVWRDSLWFV